MQTVLAMEKNYFSVSGFSVTRRLVNERQAQAAFTPAAL
jgi:hypothetical protein